MRQIIRNFAFSLALLSAASAAEPQAEPPFASEIYLFGVEDEMFPPAPCSTLFVGSSSIRFWTRLQADFPNLRSIRRGYGGSTIADTNFYFDRIVARYQPRQIVFYAGENDINLGATPDQVFEEFERFMEKKSAALNETPVFFISIKPSKARIAEFDRQSEANSKIRALAEARADLVYVDIASPMMNDGAPKDIFISDNLHMSGAGYDIWRAEIGRALKKSKTSGAPHCKP